MKQGKTYLLVLVFLVKMEKYIGTYLKHIMPEILQKYFIGLLYENMFSISLKANSCSNLKQFASDLKCLGLFGSTTISLMIFSEVRR